MMKTHTQTARWISPLALSALVLVAVGCSGDGGTDYWEGYEDDEFSARSEAGAAPSSGPIDVSATFVQPIDSPVGSGTIKSYLEDIEKEPPLSTGSIFANGFSLENYDGPGQRPALAALQELLGLGSGDLTVLALFDRSVSMSDPWEGQPRWKAAGRAFVDGLRGYEESVTLGAIFFPQAAECDVAPLSDPRQIQFQTGTRFVQNWEAFPQNRFPSGGTPLGPAFEEADLVIDEALEIGLIGAGRRFRIAVLTDGKPNCGTDEQRVFFLAQKWRDAGVEIHVIGLPGSSEAQVFLDQLALIGGTGQSTAVATPEEAEQSVVTVVK